MARKISTRRESGTEARQERVARLLATGVVSLTEIARREKVSLPTISNDVKKVREKWKIATVENYAIALGMTDARLTLLMQEYWNGYLRSCQDKASNKTKETKRPKKPNPIDPLAESGSPAQFTSEGGIAEVEIPIPLPRSNISKKEANIEFIAIEKTIEKLREKRDGTSSWLDGFLATLKEWAKLHQLEAKQELIIKGDPNSPILHQHSQENAISLEEFKKLPYEEKIRLQLAGTPMKRVEQVEE